MEKNFWVWVVGALIVGLLIGFLAAPAVKKPAKELAPTVITQSEENKAVVRNLLEAADRGDLDGLDAQLTSDYVFHFGANPQMDKATHRQLVANFRAGFPDLKHVIDSQYVSGDTVVTRGYFEGTHNGAFQGVAATGNKIKVTFIFVDRIQDGKIVEEWAELDSQGLLQQIGVLPTPGQ